MEELNEIKKKVNHLEYTELKDLKDNLSEVKKDLALNTQLTEQAIVANAKLSETLTKVQETMLLISESLKQSSKEMIEYGAKLANIDSKFESKINDVEEQVDIIENKGKIDTQELIAKSITNIVEKIIFLAVGGGLVYILVNNTI